ncbi:hypothetical protein GGI12_006240 [Dipsacomyces acuminosporus]|nr:hypothetical protein GGI12_006240 [Dipsacomyces acuminosporus]
MLRTTIQRQARSVAPIRATMISSRSYSDRFQERETASENKYIREKEAEKIKRLEEELAKAKKQYEELKAKTASADKKD